MKMMHMNLFKIMFAPYRTMIAVRIIEQIAMGTKVLKM